MPRPSLQRLFLRWVRPLAPLLCLAVYAAYWAGDRTPRATHLMEILVLSVVLAATYSLALRRFTPAAVLRVALPLDTVVVGLLTLATDRPASVALAYFWSVTLAAALLGPRDTLANTAIACVAAAVLPSAAGFRLDTLVTVTIVLVLALIGAMVAVLSGVTERAERELAREQDVDAAALRIIERMRTSLDPFEVLDATVAALGAETDAVRAIARRIGVENVNHVWARHDAPPYEEPTRNAAMRVVLERRQPLDVDLEGADADTRAYMERSAAQRIVARPVVSGGRVIAVFGVHLDREDPWPGRTPALLARIAESVATAIGQAEVHQRAQELTRMREELVANVSHELRTPLTSTLGFLKTLEARAEAFDEERRRELLAVARREAERLAELVQDLLELSTLERGTVRLAPEHVDLAAIAREAAETNAGGVDVQAPESVPVRADPNRLLQVLRNLVDNALRHGSAPVRIACSVERGVARISVTDAGPGVPDAHVGDLFTPFAHWSGRSDSSGLGLAISRRIVVAHGGELTYVPRRNGTPHAFVVELPLA